MTSIVELFPKCRKLAYDSWQMLSQIQNGLLNPSELYLSLDALHMQLDIMESLVNKETPESREVWKHKIVEIREDAKIIRKQGEDYDRKMNANIRHQKERDELLRRRKQRRIPNGSNNVDENDMSNLAEEGQSIQQSTNMVNEYIVSAQSSLQSLSQQRSGLGRVTNILSDMSNRLGLTQSTMRIIERRDITDAYLVFGGMIVTCLVLYVVWFVEW